MTNEAPPASSEKPSLAQKIWKGMQWTAGKVSGAATGFLMGAVGGSPLAWIRSQLHGGDYSDPNAVKTYAFIFPAKNEKGIDDCDPPVVAQRTPHTSDIVGKGAGSLGV